MAEELGGVTRRGKLMEILREREKVSVKEMAAKFGVSEMTIRRDFHTMEEQGLVTVHYGGATLRNAHPSFQDFSLRQEKLYRNKLCIARRAASLVQEGDVVFLDTSTTVLLMLRYLPQLHMTIFTNSLPVIEEAYRLSNVQLHIAPGLYQDLYGGPLDQTTAEYLSRFHFDKAFFGSSALDARFGASAVQEIEAASKSCVCANADRNYLLVDHTKFGKKNLIKYNSVSDYDVIFSDAELSQSVRDAVAQQGGRVEICE